MNKISIASELNSLQKRWTELKSAWEGLQEKEIARLEELLIPSLVKLLNVAGEERSFLHDSACQIRKKEIGDIIQVRGLIAVSNICSENCLYCPMRRDNLKSSNKIRMQVDEIRDQAQTVVNAGIKTLFIQSGEDKVIVPIIKEALAKIMADEKLKNLNIVLNLGNLSKEEYQTFFNLGIRGYLLKHETSDATLFEKMRPDSSNLAERIASLIDAREVGLQIGTGIIVGLPDQTDESLARDIILAGFLKSWSMVSCSPFTASEETPLAGLSSGNFWKTLNMIAIYRHLFPKARIPAVSNLDNLYLETKDQNLKISGQSAAINAGANGITINMSSSKIRNDYKIYDREERRHIVDFNKAHLVSNETGLPLDID